MDFYLNENNLISDLANILENLKEIKEIYDFAKEKNCKIYIKDNLEYEDLAISPQIGMALGLLKHCSIIETDGYDMLEINQIQPSIDNYYFIELMSLCYKYNNSRIVSLTNESEINDIKYTISYDNDIRAITNIIGKSKFEVYLQLNPVPQKINEVFKKAELEFEHIKFTDKAYKTANSRSEIYKQVGFSKLLNIFRTLEVLIYPFLKGELKGFTQASIEEEFKRLTNGIEFSNESDKTMKKYGEQRTVIFNGKTLVMSYHIKVSDNRIYFIYNKKDNCIYIGHSGQHLNVAG
ncbi:hypothetical protein KTC96_06650 [Clostridium estertheticum]|uniref:hypothetical protein n=1 Tax=Clostridium estertheticum TaxID=238834 RepID=UPI001C7D64D8|nr:hypothetical protein [Clostridium estertheticum]MBX4261285.1 hypothetical protein [Clostridium estertheticum]WLC71675.1 hypothetical protein KTC96_06650 [Clostridium estertheticum]